MARVRDLEQRSEAEQGFTLVELLVSIVILGIVGAVALSAVISATRTQRTTDDLVTARQQASQAVERMTRDLRAANPLRAADANSVTVDVTRGSTCERRRYFVQGSDLNVGVSAFGSGVACNTYGATPGAESVSLVATGLTNDAGTPLLRYYRWDTSTSARTEMTPPVATGSLRSVDGVLVSATADAGERTPVTVETLVDLRNVELS